MSTESSTTYLKYGNYDDLLKIILYSSQSVLGVVPLIYHINYNNQHIVFAQTGTVGGTIVHYLVSKDKPSKKFIELICLSGEFNLVDKIGIDCMTYYSNI